jgi:Leucine-rich repeat (LRR) protein
MRHIVIFSALTLFFGIALNAKAADAVPKDVQEVIDKIKELGGQSTLTPENTIKTIRFDNGSKLDAGMFDLFAKQPDLELLHVAEFRELNDAIVDKLTGLKKLKTLNLINGGISDVAIKTIAAAFPDLVGLDVSSNARLTDVATREIAKLKQLEILGLLFCNISDFGIMNIATLPKLRTLDIRGNMKIGDGGMKALAGIPTLRSLKHRNPEVSDEGIKAFIGAKALDNLEIQDFRITGQSGEYIRQMEKLVGLIIFRCENFDSQGVLALKGLKLERLTLRGLPIDDSAMEVFQGLPTIKRLYLHELPSVSDDGMLHIGHLKDLVILDVWDVPLTDQSVETIVTFANLRILSLRGTQMTDAGLEKLLTMPKLESVTLADNADVTPEMIKKLQDTKKFIVR